jgi:hypothetical protein
LGSKVLQRRKSEIGFPAFDGRDIGAMHIEMSARRS